MRTLLMQGFVLFLVAATAFHAGHHASSVYAPKADKIRSRPLGDPGVDAFQAHPEASPQGPRKGIFQGQGSKNSSIPANNSVTGVRAEDGSSSAAAKTPVHLQSDTFVMYAFSDTDPEYLANLEFFVRHGISEGDGCDYIFVIQKETDKPVPSLPKLPSNARYMRHANECFDWGTFGWVLNRIGEDANKYKYIILMNSSVRGPFQPATWPKGRHWSRAFTDRITADVKLVGPTISCEGIEKGTSIRHNPHTQSYLLATDQVGLAVLKDNGHVFKCHTELLDAVWDAELGSSKAILTAGYNLDCLMLRYQGVDWRDKRNWKCNGGENPYLEFQNDGVSIQPLEVMFVKIKARHLDTGWTSQLNALKLQHWMDDAVALGRPTNVGVDASGESEEIADLKLPRNLVMSTYAENGTCFDVAHYMDSNTDLPRELGGNPREVVKHFIEHGQWEGRPFSFSCGHMYDKAHRRVRQHASSASR